jgi:hypothetical protein
MACPRFDAGKTEVRMEKPKKDKRPYPHGKRQCQGGKYGHNGPGNENFFSAMDIGKSTGREQENRNRKDIDHLNQSQLHGTGLKLMADNGQGNAHGG